MAGSVEYVYNKVRTGWPSEKLETLKRSVAQYCRRDYDVTKMYIGKASGRYPEAAMKQRYDDFKRKKGFNRMIAIYETTSEKNSNEVERELIDHFEDRKKGIIINKRGGGGGPPSEGPNYYVYLALKTQ